MHFKCGTVTIHQWYIHVPFSLGQHNWLNNLLMFENLNVVVGCLGRTQQKRISHVDLKTFNVMNNLRWICISLWQSSKEIIGPLSGYASTVGRFTHDLKFESLNVVSACTHRKYRKEYPMLIFKNFNAMGNLRFICNAALWQVTNDIRFLFLAHHNWSTIYSLY
jgi:hypothetical protein